MDWRSVQFDWNRARAFLVTAEEGSLSAAARALAMTQPTVGRQVSALERELGVALFARAGNRLELTPSGLDLLEHVRAMGAAATRVSFAATGQETAIEGTVSITASEAVAAFLLPPIVGRLRVDHPGIEVEIVASNEVRDLNRREADIAIRNVRPSQGDLIARKLNDGQAYLYATPAYLARIGPGVRAPDLGGAEVFAFDRTDIMVDGLRALGLELSRRQFPVVTGNHLVQWALCKQGVGICIMMAEVGDADPDVVRVLPEVALPVALWMVCHHELRTNRRIRLVFDRLAEALSPPGLADRR